MPYIKPEDRERLAAGDFPRTAGEVNYLVSSLIAKELAEKGKSYALLNDIVADLDDAQEMVNQLTRFPGSRAGDFADAAFSYIFQTSDLDGISDLAQTKTPDEADALGGRCISARGALECAKLELYIRIARPYEDAKIHDNGDVYQ